MPSVPVIVCLLTLLIFSFDPLQKAQAETDVSSSSILVLDCPMDSDRSVMVVDCLHIPGVVIGSQWVAVPLSQLDNCRERNTGEGKPRGACFILPGGAKGLTNQSKLEMAARIWQPSNDSGLIQPGVGSYSTSSPAPFSPDGEICGEPFPVDSSRLQLAVLEFHRLIDGIGPRGGYRIVPINTAQRTSEPSDGQVVFSREDPDGYGLNVRNASLTYLGWLPEMLGRFVLDEPVANVSYFGGVYDVSAASPGEVSNFGYLDELQNILLWGWNLSGYLALGQRQGKVFYFADIQYNREFLQRVIDPWRWTSLQHGQLPARSKNVLGTGGEDECGVSPSPSQAASKSVIYACRNRLGEVGMLVKGNCITVSDNHQVSSNATGYQVLTGFQGDQMHWRSWRKALPIWQQTARIDRVDGVTDHTARLHLTAPVAAEGYSRFGVHRLIANYPVASLCLVSKNNAFWLGRRDKMSDQCIYPWRESDQAEYQVSLTTDFQVISHIKR